MNDLLFGVFLIVSFEILVSIIWSISGRLENDSTNSNNS